jgi:hypothetical protein
MNPYPPKKIPPNPERRLINKNLTQVIPETK